MSRGRITAARLAAQEQVFAEAYGRGDLEIAPALYHPEVVYLSPTVRLFDYYDPSGRLEVLDASES